MTTKDQLHRLVDQLPPGTDFAARVANDAKAGELDAGQTLQAFARLLADQPGMERAVALVHEAAAASGGDTEAAINRFLSGLTSEPGVLVPYIEAVLRAMIFLAARPEGTARGPLTAYIEAAMRHARYETLEDGTHFGSLPHLQGAWANAGSLDACRAELREVAEEWVIVGLRRGSAFPKVDGLTLEATGTSA